MRRNGCRIMAGSDRLELGNQPSVIDFVEGDSNPGRGIGRCVLADDDGLIHKEQNDGVAAGHRYQCRTGNGGHRGDLFLLCPGITTSWVNSV